MADSDASDSDSNSNASNQSCVSAGRINHAVECLKSLNPARHAQNTSSKDDEVSEERLERIGDNGNNQTCLCGKRRKLKLYNLQEKLKKIMNSSSQDCSEE